MAFSCRDDSCLRPFDTIAQRTIHERLMHFGLVKDAARRLIQRVVSLNPSDKCKLKVITAGGQKYSYYDALELSKQDSEEGKAVLSVFEGIVNDFFLESPEEGVRELLTAREYTIRGK